MVNVRFLSYFHSLEEPDEEELCAEEDRELRAEREQLDENEKAWEKHKSEEREHEIKAAISWQKKVDEKGWATKGARGSKRSHQKEAEVQLNGGGRGEEQLHRSNNNSSIGEELLPTPPPAPPPPWPGEQYGGNHAFREQWKAELLRGPYQWQT